MARETLLIDVALVSVFALVLAAVVQSVRYLLVRHEHRDIRYRPFTRSVHMAKATWNGTVLAESDRAEIVENNVYFPPDAVRREHLRDSATHSTCPWKGLAEATTTSWSGPT